MSENPRAERDEAEGNPADLYEHAPCALLSTRPDGTLIRVNQTFVDWFKRPREELLGKTRFQELLSVGARIYHETHYAPLLQMQGFVNEIALEMRRRDGTTVPVVASARQVRDAAGTVIINRIALFDSTDRRRYERELLIARRQAEEAARELADADRRKNEFIAMLAHELRNPLAPIRGAVEIFRRSDAVSEMLSKTTAMMDRQVAQMSRLVEDLLDVSRIGQDKLTLRRVAVDLASVVHHAIETSEPLLQSAGVKFSVNLAAKPIYVEADAPRLAQAIGNVLNNAAKFTPRGGAVWLTLTLVEQHAEIRVRDSGIGIEPDQLARVFELFAQEQSLVDRPDGLGIGLALAKSLVERHDGRISVHSEGRGKGAEFVIRLGVLSAAPESVSRAFTPPEPPGPASPRRILVVDDNDDSAQSMGLLLESAGHQIRIAHDGLEAVAEAEAFQPEVILLDIGLPKLNGYDAAVRIRELPIPQPLLVALTGWGQEEDRRRTAVAGFDVHLVKPVDYGALIKLLSDARAPS
jgi:PAS domain S-box-containing protein